MSWFRPRRVVRRRDGQYELRLSADERGLLKSVAMQLLERMVDGDGTDPALARLRPPAYAHDPDREAEYRSQVGDDLDARRRKQIATLLDASEATRLSEEQLYGTMTALNDLRLVVGTLLDVSEETTPGDFEKDSQEEAFFALYGWLSVLQEDVVSALS